MSFLKFYIHLKRDSEVLKLPFKNHDTCIGNKWAKCLKDTIDNNSTISWPDRIYNFNDVWSTEKAVSDINDCVIALNKRYGYHKIDLIEYEGKPTQDDLNRLHHEFKEASITQKWRNEPDLFYPIHALNLLIHRLELHKDTSKIVVTFKNPDYFPFSIEDYEYFGLRWPIGTIALNYTHIGKTVLDMFKDGDIDHMDDLVPQNRYAATFSVWLSTCGFSVHFVDRVNKWKEEKRELFLKECDIDLKSPEAAVGFCVVGNIDGEPDTIKEEFYGVTEILRISYDK